MAAGNLIAGGTSTAGPSRSEEGAVVSVRLRFTTHDLTASEQKHATLTEEHELYVRRGRFFVGEPRHLPSIETDAVPREMGNPDAWVDVPSGHYHVRVHAIAWLQAEGALRDGSPSEKALPAFVIQLVPV